MSDLLLCDIQHSVSDVVCGHLPVPVDEATPPAILTHWKHTGKKITHNSKKILSCLIKICFIKVGSALQKILIDLFLSCAAVLALTRQWALRLLQVEDFMEGSLFGAVRATRLFLSAHPTRDSGEAAPWNHRLNLKKERERETEQEERGGRRRMKDKRRKDDWCDDLSRL